jgi:diadenosine tetraphosphate (Ap4A) HIT family hydrolase
VNGGCPVVVEVDGSRAIEDCALCSVTLAPVIARAEHWLVVLNRNQNLLGKSMVVLRRHEETLQRTHRGSSCHPAA